MKNRIRSAIILGLIFLLAGTTQKVAAQTEDVSLQSFYDELSPYGTWIQDSQYGYVWRPDVDQEEFRPYYTNGKWAMTEYGNTWVSNYDWGWAPFHYGRWLYNSYNQWVWLPDTVWGPAWVSWRSGGGYYGWAPLGPSISIGINIGRGGYRVPDMCWNFIPYNNIYYNSYPRYNYGRNRVYIQNTVIINNTYVRNNRTYYTGPRIDDIRRQTNQRVNVYSVNRSHNPGASRIENNRINIYQPQSRPSRDNEHAAPRTAVRGSINHETIGRDHNVTANRGDVRSENRNQGNRPGNNDRSNTPYTRPQRTENGGSAASGRSNSDRSATSPQNSNNGQRPSVFGRTRSDAQSEAQRVERSASSSQQQADRTAQRGREVQQQQAERQQSVERNAQASQEQAQRNAQRSREMQQQQAERQRVERSQSAPQQRIERPQASPRAERRERPQAQPQQRGSSGSESRGGGRPSGGRPGRG